MILSGDNCLVMSLIFCFSLISSNLTFSPFIFLIPLISLDIFSSAIRSCLCACNGVTTPVYNETRTHRTSQWKPKELKTVPIWYCYNNICNNRLIVHVLIIVGVHLIKKINWSVSYHSHTLYNENDTTECFRLYNTCYIIIIISRVK